MQSCWQLCIWMKEKYQKSKAEDNKYLTLSNVTYAYLGMLEEKDVYNVFYT